MNIELLTKLVKLANHNPNENEANLAARKVCDMIEKSEFKFVSDKTNVFENYNLDYGNLYSTSKPYTNKSSADFYNEIMEILKKI